MELKRRLLCAIMVLASLSTFAENKARTVYMYGFAASFNDSTVYFTEIQQLDSAYVDSKTKFLYSRENYSYQLRDYLGAQGFKNATCITSFAMTRKDLALTLARETGMQLALPFACKQPIEMHYRLWQGQAPDAVDECRIPSTQGKPVVPEVILVPCLAFTPSGYRLGYGGGYFDRFMAKHPGVTAIGVAWQHNQLSDTQLRAQAHDQALLAVVTEANIFSP